MSDERAAEDVWAENRRLHDEIRSLNGQIEGVLRAMAGLRSRLDRTLQENAELRAALSGSED